MALVLATSALLIACLIGIPVIAGSAWTILFVLGASNGRPATTDIVFPAFLILTSVAAIAAAGVYLGHLL